MKKSEVSRELQLGGEAYHENTALKYKLISGRDWQNEVKTGVGRL